MFQDDFSSGFFSVGFHVFSKPCRPLWNFRRRFATIRDNKPLAALQTTA
jgi:hypothetical protein